MRRQYRLYEEGGVRFSTFLHFYRAMQTLEATTEHYSTIRYRLADQTRWLYRLHQDPVQTGTRVHESEAICVFTCPERPTMSVRAFESLLEMSTKFAKVRLPPSSLQPPVETELSEIWSYATASCLYVLSKTSIGTTKEFASHADPVFGITIESDQNSCVYDLFGRYREGREDRLAVLVTPTCPEVVTPCPEWTSTTCPELATVCPVLVNT